MRTIWIAVFLALACGTKKPAENVALQLAQDGGIDFAIQDMEGNPVQLSQYRGKTVLLNIWATWCGPCKREIPDLNTVHAEFASKNVVVLGVLLESGPREDAKAAMEKNFVIQYPQWYGNEALGRQFEVIAFPTTIVIDKSGKIVDRMIGQQTKERFVDALTKAGA